MMVMPVTEEGQISVDFLLGISVFLLTFGFVIQFIPGLFISTSGDGSLNSVVYRTANILADDPGWWQNKTDNGTDWEMHIGDLSRIGLATDKSPGTRQTRTPRMLNKTKIQQVIKLNETVLTNNLGLYEKISGSQVDYVYNITLEQNGNPMIIDGSRITFGETPPTSQDVFKITRLVLVENGSVAGFGTEELTPNSTNNNIAMVNVRGPQNEDVILQIRDLKMNSTFNGTKLNGRSLIIPDDFRALKEIFGDYGTYNISSPFNSTDTLRLIFNHILFPDNTTYQLELDFTRMNFTQTGPPIEYTSKIEPLYEPATLVVEAWT